MARETPRPKSPGTRRPSILPGLRILAVLLGVPVAILLYQAHNSGLPLTQVFTHIFKGARTTETENHPTTGSRGAKLDFLTPVPIGFPSPEPPRIGSHEIVDL